MSPTSDRETAPDEYRTPPRVAKMLGVSADKIIRWIKDGSLPAVNVAAGLTSRPRWRIRVADLQDFLLRRAAVPPPPCQRRRRRPEDAQDDYY